VKGVGPQAISRAVRERRLIPGHDKLVDPTTATNRAYLGADPWERIGKLGAATTAAGSGGNGHRRVDVRLRAFASKAEVELEKKHLECEKLAIQNAASRRELAPVLTATRALADLGEVLRVQLLYLPRRMAARILAAAQGGADVKKIEALLITEIAGGIEKFRDAAVVRFEEHLAEIAEQEGDNAEEA
jgi:hypothetical protein